MLRQARPLVLLRHAVKTHARRTTFLREGEGRDLPEGGRGGRRGGEGGREGGGRRGERRRVGSRRDVGARHIHVCFVSGCFSLVG